MLASCSPQVFTMGIDMRQKSVSGYDLRGKDMAVAYTAGPSDTLMLKSVAESFARFLEHDYYADREAIGLYRLDWSDKADYASKDTLVSLVMDTGADVVFLFSKPSGSYGYLYVYDSMGDDKVGTYAYKPKTYNTESVLKKYSADLARNVGTKFISTWKEDSFPFIYYDFSGDWEKASIAASEYRFPDAISLWMGMLGTRSKEKRACLEYNIAQACYLEGNYDLALRWLDASDKESKVEYSNALRKKIEAVVKK